MGTDQAAQTNLAKLFDDDSTTVWASGASETPGTAEFEVVVEFVGDVSLNTLTLQKDGTVGNYAATYMNACVSLFDAGNNAVGSPICATDEDGMAGQTNADAEIAFDMSGETTTAVRFAKLTFDTTDAPPTATGNGGAEVKAKGLSMAFTPTP